VKLPQQRAQVEDGTPQRQKRGQEHQRRRTRRELIISVLPAMRALANTSRQEEDCEAESSAKEEHGRLHYFALFLVGATASSILRTKETYVVAADRGLRLQATNILM
jgi:hypothetical protein